MDIDDDEWPKPASCLTNEPADISRLRAYLRTEGCHEVWIPLYPDIEDVDCDRDDVLKLGIGVVPTTGIESFVIEIEDIVATLGFRGGEWRIAEIKKLENLDQQEYVHQMESFVRVHPVKRVKR